jgi:uncharacterized membrane protein YadS
MQTLTSSALDPSSARSLPGHSLVPGILLTGTIAAGAFELRNFSGIATLSPLIIAIVLGLVFHNTVGTPAAFKPGVVFSMRRVLRFAIIAKLSRVMLLAPMILVLGCLRVSNREHDRGEASKPQSVPVPWFVTGLSQ